MGTPFAVAAFIFAMAQACALAQSAGVCQRFPQGSAITQPPDLFSEHGVLQVNLTYRTALDEQGNTLFCFLTDDGSQSPTLHVQPGDRLLISLKNGVPPSPSPMAMPSMPGMSVSRAPSDTCGDATMTPTSANIHYHGTNTPPTCHQDDVLRTMISSGETFQYDLQFPLDEPPGLYWYHPHIHGTSEAAVQGGASGAIIVEGIQNVNPEVAGLPQQVLIIRDSHVPGNPPPGGNGPTWDLSLNYVPVPAPAFTPAVIAMKPTEKQFWRVLNASADSTIDLQLQYDGTPQPLEVVGLDGIPIGSQDGTSLGKRLTETDILLSPAARAEFIVNGPSASVKNATLMTLHIDTGPNGPNHPTRPIASIVTSNDAPEPPQAVPSNLEPARKQRFAQLDQQQPTAERTLYFSEENSKFFITVDGQTPTTFDGANPPAIVTTQGAVEDWTIENRSPENHEFHIHQIHFLLLEQNGVPISNGQYLDVIQVPYWPGTGPYPSVKIRMDFRGPVVGDFVYHCHILAHEDHGMMAVIRVRRPLPHRGKR